MRILLIKPGPRHDMDVSLFRVTQPLGLMYLASYVRERRDDKIKILDLRIYPPKQRNRAIELHVQKLKPQVIGISATTYESDHLFMIAENIRALLPSATIVAGGPHITAYALESLKNVNIDFGITGEGEEPFYKLLNALDSGSDISSISALVFRDHNNNVQANRSGQLPDPQSLPLPAWDMIPLWRYHRFQSMSMCGPRKFACIFTSRGCPYQCVYCHNIFGKQFRARPVQSIIEEIVLLKNKYGITDFEIIDDCFNFDKKRTIKFFQTVIDMKLGIKIQFPNALRVDLLDRHIIKLMARAGVNYLCVAIETGSAELQCFIKKYLDIPYAMKMIEYADRAGIYVAGFFMIGFPGESRSQIRKTIDFACNSRLSQAIFFKVIPYKNTGLWKYIDIEDSQAEKIGKYSYNFAFANLSRLTDLEYSLMYALAYLRFYTPARIIRILFKLPGMNDDFLTVLTLYINSILPILFRILRL